MEKKNSIVEIVTDSETSGDDQTHGVVTADQIGGANHNQGVQAGGLQETKSHGGQRKIAPLPKVEPYMRHKYNSQDYDPLVATFGLYNRKLHDADDQPLAMVEDFKDTAMKWFVAGTAKNADSWFSEVWDMVPDLRRCYTKESSAAYGNAELTRLLFQDACLAIMVMEVANLDYQDFSDFFENQIGVDTVLTIIRDSFLLENQLPFWFIRTLLHGKFGVPRGKARWRRFFVAFAHGGKSTSTVETKVYWDKDAVEPDHYVEALKIAMITGMNKDKKTKAQKHQATEEEDEHVHLKAYYAIRSVTQLKTKGINVKRNNTNSFKSITFEPNCISGATLFLPADRVGYGSRAVYANIIAYEMSSENLVQDYTMTAYLHFMKSLLQSPTDVEELQHKGIIINMLGSNEQVMNLYRDIYTIGANCSSEYKELCQRMEEHYSNTTKTWLSELWHTYFRSPWTVITLFGSILVVILTIMQSYYAATEGRDKGKSRP